MPRIINQDGEDVTAKTLASIQKVIGSINSETTENDLKKATGTVTLATGLVAYNLEAPAKNLYPVLTPIRNRIPRKTTGSGAGQGPNWKVVSAIAGTSSMPVMPWVPEGQRSPRMSITTADKSATYVTLGLETDVTFEAQSAGQGFEDVLATSGMRLLQQTMILEEYAFVGGNKSVNLGTPATPTVSNAGTGGTVAAATYNVYVFALTFEGYLMATVTNGIKRQVTLTGMDNKTYTLNGGSSIASAAGSTTTTGATSTVSASTTAIRGAIAYAWYVGTAGAEKLEAITTINSVKLTALAATGQAYSAVTSPTLDYSKNATAFDGLLYSAFEGTSSAYYVALATGTAGTGTVLTGTTRGTITEIDTMLKSMWDNYRISPEEIYVNAQELTNIYTKCFVSGSNPMVRFNIDAASPQQATFSAGQILGWYTNPYSLDGGQYIPIRLHPYLPAGTILAWTQNLPAYYQSSNVPQTAEVDCRRDYYQIPWPIITRANETGVYSEEVLKIYATFSLGVITNIANG